MPFRLNPRGVTPAAAGDLAASVPEGGGDTQTDIADRATEPAADTTGEKYIHRLRKCEVKKIQVLRKQDFSFSLDIRYGSLGISKLYLIKKMNIFQL